MSRKPSSSSADGSCRPHRKPGHRIARAPQRSLVAAAVASCLVLGTPAALGQSANSNLRGQVTSVSGTAADTEVVATNVATSAVRRTRTNADGNYVLIGLPPGTYRIEAGGITDTVTLSVASNATLNLQPDDEGEAIEEVTVVGYRRAAPDVVKSEVGGTVSLRTIEQLPQATRN